MHMFKVNKMLKINANTALILVDFQTGFDNWNYWGGERNNPNAETNASLILNNWREASLPLFHIKHCSTNMDSLLHESNAGNDFIPVVYPLQGEKVIKKSVNSAFIGTELENELRAAMVDSVVIIGLTTDHCVSTTARMASNLGFETIVVQDACATFNKAGFNGMDFSAQLIHETAIASLNNEFAVIVNTADLLL